MRQYGGEEATPKRFLHTQAPPFNSPLPEGGYIVRSPVTVSKKAKKTLFAPPRGVMTRDGFLRSRAGASALVGDGFSRGTC